MRSRNGETNVNLHKRCLLLCVFISLLLVIFGMYWVSNVTITFDSPEYLKEDVHIKPQKHATSSHSSILPTEPTGMRTSELPSTLPQGIDRHEYPYMILERDICKPKNSTEVYLVIVVVVSPANLEHRKVIRNTWGSVVKYDQEIKLIFMLGKTNNASLQRLIFKESKTYHDLVQEDFIDSYKNLSIKSVAMLKWVSAFCSQAKYLLKADDDMYINVNYLVGVLKHRTPKNSAMCCMIHGARPIRSKDSKWYAPPEVYSEQVYPDYCSGTAYVLSADTVPKLFSASKKRKIFWLEDVFITGICRTAINANLVNDWGFTLSKPNPDGCTFRKRITGHRYSLAEIQKIWTEVNDPNLKCKTN